MIAKGAKTAVSLATRPAETLRGSCGPEGDAFRDLPRPQGGDPSGGIPLGGIPLVN